MHFFPFDDSIYIGTATGFDRYSFFSIYMMPFYGTFIMLPGHCHWNESKKNISIIACVYRRIEKDGREATEARIYEVEQWLYFMNNCGKNQYETKKTLLPIAKKPKEKVDWHVSLIWMMFKKVSPGKSFNCKNNLET